MLADVASGLLEKGINFEVTDKAKAWLAERGFDPLFGARPMRRLIQEHVEDTLSDAIISGTFNPGDTAVIDISKDKMVVKVEPPLTVKSS
jgi:ATP-dependent Clp protease ATP-binding subunit ClpC